MSGPSPIAFDELPAATEPVRLPVAARVFETRAARFRELAPGHPLADYLMFLASLTAAQANACRIMPSVFDGQPLDRDVPLRAVSWRRGTAWQHALRSIGAELCRTVLPVAVVEALEKTATGAPAALESAADAILHDKLSGADLAGVPLVASALQAYWTTMASLVPAEGVAPGRSHCPLCGSPPVAGTVLGDRKLRYLTCGLCAAQWHVTRVMCVTCGATGGLSYLAIDGGSPGVKAEACGACRTYTKLFYLEQQPRAEPLADDVATLGLDLLMTEEGYARPGANLFVLSPAS
jgi:FdhE protein